MGPAVAVAITLLDKARPRFEDLPDGHERFIFFGIPWFDSRRVERRLARRLKRVELRKARRDARKASK